MERILIKMFVIGKQSYLLVRFPDSFFSKGTNILRNHSISLMQFSFMSTFVYLNLVLSVVRGYLREKCRE